MLRRNGGPKEQRPSNFRSLWILLRYLMIRLKWATMERRGKKLHRCSQLEPLKPSIGRPLMPSLA